MKLLLFYKKTYIIQDCITMFECKIFGTYKVYSNTKNLALLS